MCAIEWNDGIVVGYVMLRGSEPANIEYDTRALYV